MIASQPDTRMISTLRGPVSDSPGYAAELAEQRRILRWTFSQLAGRHARVIALRYENGLPWKQVAEIMGISETAAILLHGRVLDRLRASLAELGVHTLRGILTED
jgi:DNA-directed RNA polymerase specialized sigma subunit